MKIVVRKRYTYVSKAYYYDLLYNRIELQQCIELDKNLCSEVSELCR
jgi:hypothetical protein